ncbi:hypothetical protein F5Y10DRAFT_228590 [Nemania abortiva]|nr:hypothetical protein F5Y10DRAFT_228590 [Nemania abortiva]
MSHTYILKPGEAALGCDFGSSSSKQALAFIEDDVDRVMMMRVPVAVGITKPDWNSDYELGAFAALNDDDELVIGKECLTVNATIPLKTLLTYRSGITSERVVNRLPGGTTLRRAIRSQQINDEKIDNALVQHFDILHKSAHKQASEFGVEIKVVVLTYPNYLCAYEKNGDFDRYMEKYLSFMRFVWGDEVKFKAVSEGQAAAAYICEEFYDSLGSRRGEFRQRDLFRDLDRENGLNLLIVDAGASTLNLQALSAYFSDGQLSKAMSNVPFDAKTGAQGGSDVCNHAVESIMEREHLALFANRNLISRSQLAALMADFERKKKSFDYTLNNEVLELEGGKATVLLRAEQVRKVFKNAFAEGMKLLGNELTRMIRLGHDFAVLFCGGSYQNPGLHREVEGLMERTRTAGRRKGVKIQYTFLRDERHASSAVSAGAAVGMMRVPFPIDVLKGSAIGLHEIRGPSCDDNSWGGAPTASVLYSSSGQPPQNLDVHIQPYEQRSLKFHLVCDPNWDSVARTRSSRHIDIGRTEEVLGGPLATYDLGFTVLPEQIPCGTVRFRLEALDENTHEWDRPISINLHCFKVSDTSPRIPVRDKKNTQWLLTLKTGLQTKLLEVENDPAQLPIYDCRICDQIIEDYWECDECEDFLICEQCYDTVEDNPLRRHLHPLVFVSG